MKIYEQQGIAVEFTGEHELTKLELGTNSFLTIKGECTWLEVNNFYSNVRYYIKGIGYCFEHDVNENYK